MIGPADETLPEGIRVATPVAMAQLRDIVARAGWQGTPCPPGTAAARGYKLRDAVLGSFASWSTMFEGALPYMYTDVRGLVTTGIGNLIDPVSEALALPWVRSDGTPASPSEIAAAWATVKGAFPRRQSVACGPLTTIRLTRQGIATLVEAKLLANDAYLAEHLPGYAAMPADAQLACNSMAWAVGAGVMGIFKTLATALERGDYATATQECEINSKGNPGVVPRNTANIVLFGNAAMVAAGHGDPDRLYFLDAVDDVPTEAA